MLLFIITARLLNISMIRPDMHYLGMPSHDRPMYALYEPVADLFLAVGSDLAEMQELVCLFSSRYIIYLCELSSASNYTPELLGNEVCGRWTISNKQDFPITRFPLLYNTISAKMLVEHQRPLPWNFSNDQEYIILAYQYIKGFVANCLEKAAYYSDTSPPLKLTEQTARFKQRVERLPGAPFNNPYLTAIERINEIIYTEFDVNVARGLLQTTQESIPRQWPA